MEIWIHSFIWSCTESEWVEPGPRPTTNQLTNQPTNQSTKNKQTQIKSVCDFWANKHDEKTTRAVWPLSWIDDDGATWQAAAVSPERTHLSDCSNLIFTDHELKHGSSFISASSSSSTHLWAAAGTSCPGLTGIISLKFNTSCCWRWQRRRPHLLRRSNTCRTGFNTEITAAYEAFQNRKWHARRSQLIISHS